MWAARERRKLVISRKEQIPATTMSAIKASYSLLKSPNPTDRPEAAGGPVSGVHLHTIPLEFLPGFLFFQLSALSAVRQGRGKRNNG